MLPPRSATSTGDCQPADARSPWRADSMRDDSSAGRDDSSAGPIAVMRPGLSTLRVSGVLKLRASSISGAAKGASRDRSLMP